MTTKLVLAAISGFFVAIDFQYLSETAGIFGWFTFYGLSGLIFAAGVLWPHLARDASRYVRAIATVVVSVASYWCAVQTWEVLSGPDWPRDILSVLSASLVGAAIVWAALPSVLGMKWSARFAWLGLAAAAAGGLLFHIGMELGDFGLYLGYTCWHLSMATAISLSTRRSQPQ